MIILYLVDKGLLDKPVLYISDFFEKHKNSYYDALSMVKTSNNIDQWLRFFLKGVTDTAKDSINTFEKVITLRKDSEQKILSLGRKSKTRMELLTFLYSKPNINARLIQEKFNLSTPAANKLITEFVEIKILKEKTGFKRNRYFVFEDYLKIFRG